MGIYSYFRYLYRYLNDSIHVKKIYIHTYARTYVDICLVVGVSVIVTSVYMHVRNCLIHSTQVDLCVCVYKYFKQY